MIPRIPSLPDLVSRFLRADFSFDDVNPLLGVVAEEDATVAKLALYPGNNVAQARLEKLQLPGKPPMLVGLSIEFEKPVTVDFADLARRYGPEEEGTILKINRPRSYKFFPKGSDFGGLLILHVPGGSNAARRSVSGLILRRFPPETYQPRAPFQK